MRPRAFLPIFDHAVPFTARPGNVRFWVYNVSGWVKITMRPGEVVGWSRSWDNGEGRSWEWTRYTFDGQGVQRDWGNGGSDCDGQQRQDGQDYCPAADLAGGPSYVDIRPATDRFRWPRFIMSERIVLRPNWEPTIATRCHDQFAEAMGY